MSSQYSIVHLTVKAETEFGQVVHVSGSSFTMGNFSTAEVRLDHEGGREGGRMLTSGLMMLVRIGQGLGRWHWTCIWYCMEGQTRLVCPARVALFVTVSSSSTYSPHPPPLLPSLPPLPP